MKSRTAATATAVAAGLSCAAVEVSGAGFFGPLAGTSGAVAATGSRKAPSTTPEASSRWLGEASRNRRGARRGVADSLYAIRGGASGALRLV